MSLQTETVPITDVRPLEPNPRRHPEKQIVELMKSVEQFGQYRPLVVAGSLAAIGISGLGVVIGTLTGSGVSEKERVAA